MLRQTNECYPKYRSALVYLSLRSVCGGRVVQHFSRVRVCDLSEYLCLGECASKPHLFVYTVQHNYLIVTHAFPTNTHSHTTQPSSNAVVEFAKKYILKCHTFWHNSVVQQRIRRTEHGYMLESARESIKISTISTSIYSIWQTYHARSSLAPVSITEHQIWRTLAWPWPVAGKRPPLLHIFKQLNRARIYINMSVWMRWPNLLKIYALDFTFDHMVRVRHRPSVRSSSPLLWSNAISHNTPPHTVPYLI